MATVHPALNDLRHLATPLNHGEEAVLNRLIGFLGDEWHVFVQPHILNVRPDFLICSLEQGVTVIEVKDWRPGIYRNQGGHLEVCDLAGRWTPFKEDPIQQVHRYRSTLAERVVSPPGTNEFRNVRGSVVLPQFEEEGLRRLLAETTSVTKKDQGYVALAGREALTDKGASQRMVHGGNRPGIRLDERVFQRLLDRLEEPEALSDQRRPLSLSSGAKDIATNPNDAKTRRVRGAAGSGKSLGLAARAAHLASVGQHVLVLTFNITLAHYLQDLVRRHARRLDCDHRLVDCIHFHGFCTTVTQIAGAAATGQPDTLDDVYEAHFQRAMAVYRSGVEGLPTYDAVLVDEGQDFTVPWWQFLRNDVCRQGGEMLLAVDKAQNVFERPNWTDEVMAGCGFSGPWTTLEGSYRMPPDFIPVVHEFARQFLRVPDLHLPAEPEDRKGVAASPTHRQWANVAPGLSLAGAVADAVMALLETPSAPNPADVVVLATHATGERVMRDLVSRGVYVESIFAEDKGEQRRRKVRFWPGVNALKGSTIQSFKGWEARGIVIALEASTEEHVPEAALAYVALSRVKGDPGTRSAFVTVINTVERFNMFRDRFVRYIGSDEVPALKGQMGLLGDD